MHIIEQTIVAKNPRQKSEDGIVVTPDFVAVIDGSTSKSSRRLSLWQSNGRYAMQLVSRYIRRMPAGTTCQQFCEGVTTYLRRHYSRRIMPLLAEHPEERIAASTVLFSRLQRQVWMIGDCQCLVGDQYYDNPKPCEQQLAEQRAAEVNRLLSQGLATTDELRRNDTARQTIIPAMLQTMRQQNVSYAVIDGFPIPQQHVRVITLDFQPWQLIFATDGYPQLLPTLEQSEAALQQQLTDDPLRIGRYKATKGLMLGNTSFDDRAYIRFQV